MQQATEHSPTPVAAVKQEDAVPPSSASSTTAPAPQVNTRPRRSVTTKPQTPKASSREANGRPPVASTSSAHKRVKPCFTSSTDFPAPAPESSLGPDESQPQRNQRRSKVEAISKLDRAGTPVQVASGPMATSFIPAANAPAQPSPPSGPSVQRNPLHWPPKVNPEFSIDSVKTTAPRYAPSKSGKRLFGLEDCPTYYPTAEQFQDCMGYIDTIAAEAKEYGICKIVPPEGWRMPFTLETEKFRFRTRLQQLNSLEAASRAKINFLEQLQLYHEQGDGRLVIPTIDRRPLDLYQLRKAVNKIGGHEEVNRMRGWPVIAKTLGYDERYALTIRSSYLRIILPFDTFANAGKSQSNSPLTPLANASANAAAAKPPGFTSDSPASPTRPSRMGAVRAPKPVRMGDLPTDSNPLKPSALEPPADIPSRPTSATPSGTALKIKVSGFASRDGSDSELSDEESPRKTKKKHQTGEVCEVCQRGDDAPKILLCDGCDKGFHTYCLNPPLTFVPSNEEWYCGPCLFAQGDGYGFDEGEDHSIASFQARDQAFADAWWTKHATSSQPDELSRDLGKSVVTEDDVEREFWRLTEDTNDTVEIEYGADVHSSTHGSGSPTMETHPLNKYSRDGWNLNNMPILPDSLLRYIRSDISGMTVPWIYVGMIFSAFCWHNEDHYTYSVNYMHWGETKTWYGIPGSDAEKFEAAMMSEAPELFEQQPSLLFQLVTMMNPGRITEAGVKVVACDQRPNEFVLTFPKAYHCGFNHGINFNEAVNFALPDWLSEGKASVLKYKAHAKAPVFSHNELLINITLYSETIKTAIWLKDALAEMVREETARRAKLRAEVPLLTETLEEEDIPEEQYQCTICKGFCYLSQVTCSCTKHVACVDHADFLCPCDKTQRRLRKRFSEAQLEDILSVVEARAALPGAWREKLDEALENPRPPLKNLRALLAEGEKIAYDMPEVHYLRAWVARANAWVEKAILLATRKSTGRRKKGRQTEEEEPDRSHEALQSLMDEADQLGLDAPEVHQLRQTLMYITAFKIKAAKIMAMPEEEHTLELCETALILGQSLNIELEEVPVLQTYVNRLQWFRRVEEEVDDFAISYEDVLELLEEAKENGIPGTHPTIIELSRREAKGRKWKEDVEEVLSRDVIELHDITALIEGQELTPTSIDTMRQLENISKTVTGWQATAEAQFAGQGSSNAAQRLCKAVKTASGPLGRVHIPEMAALQDELASHAQWIEGIAEVLEIQPKQVTSTLNNILQAFERQLNPEDNEPSEAFTCFCRNPATATMVTCFLCHGAYHPKCVDVAPRNVDKPFRCPMCTHTTFDDRPSLNELSHLSVEKRYNFRIVPSEMATLQRIVDVGVAFARVIVPVVDPLGQAAVCRNFDLLAHWLRKLYTLPVTFDAQNATTKQRVVFEDFLQKRMVESKGPTKPRTRPRKPKLTLKQAKEGWFNCVCTTPPEDSLATVMCYKCGQGYHATCVYAPVECLGPEGTRWRCPCCTVKEAKKTQQGDVPVRVQMSDRIGTDYYVDYKATINSFATEVIEEALPPIRCILLECVRFIPPVIPEGFVPGAVADEDEDGDRKKRRKVETNGNGHGHVVPSTPAAPTYSPAPLSYASSVVSQRPTPTTAPRTTLDVAGQRSSSHPFAGVPYHSPLPRTPLGWTPTTATAEGPSSPFPPLTNGASTPAKTLNDKPSFAGIVAGTAASDRVDMARREADTRMEVDPSVHVSPAA